MPLPTNRAGGDVVMPADHNDMAAAVNDRGINVKVAPYGCTGIVTQLDAVARINDAITDASAIGDVSRNALNAGGCPVLLPHGDYVAAEPIQYRSGVVLSGAGPRSTAILRKGNTTTKLLVPATLAEKAWGVKGLRLDGNRGNQSVAATVIDMDRSNDYETLDLPGYIAGPTGFPEAVSSIFGGGDYITMDDVVITNVLGKALTLTANNSQHHFRGLFVWFTSDHGIDEAGVDNDWSHIQVGNCGRSCFRAAGANNRYGHMKLYESDALDEGWPALELTGSKNYFELVEVQEATFSGARVVGSDNNLTVNVDGCSDVGVIINGHRNVIHARVAQFNAYQPTYLYSFGVGARGNTLIIEGKDYSAASPGFGDVVGNTVILNGERVA